ncbi:TPA: hypothetical protein ACKRBA_000187 [Streptococcus pyogenes]|uniref:hypothetical protein n=1 Tax=Streptococcus pyogenes TaxID=1314 RepID=UPI0010D2E667|nr:hypothetical protein [Streptococcus pyogenes]VHF40628.1 Uncharacterised protein [Streptococcus pyogenes]HEQ3711781.1 hypothetical protein [Streptococcus pyogenes]HEQ3833294.1 hypothetical protein [Streptococcus pyogenes]HEQ4675515.1 hypothetical protein [Streptococcus pyogenes]HER2667814.1 hypothetical protein [Streptococcus pyogenes]
MKTKSKRFLNLATLCLALLGTTLLMAQPVKAERAGESTFLVLNSDEDERLFREKLDKVHQMGEDAGYKDGKSGNPKKDRLSETVPSGIDESMSDDYWDSYENFYSMGYKQWSDEHPVEAALSWIWETITSWVQSIF